MNSVIKSHTFEVIAILHLLILNVILNRFIRNQVETSVINSYILEGIFKSDLLNCGANNNASLLLPIRFVRY
jgi:hypothetical protein